MKDKTHQASVWIMGDLERIIEGMTTKKEEKANKDKFENIAETLECDTSDEALDKVFDNLDTKAKEEKEQSEK